MHPPVKRRIGLALVALGLLAAGIVIAATDPKKQGRTSTAKLQLGSGRDLNPAGKMTRLGNYPAGGALSKNGRFLWTVSAGRGKNDIRIVRVESSTRCRKGKRGKRCRRRSARRIGRVVQTIPMPGANGGIVMAPDGKTAYVSGTPESSTEADRPPEGTPGAGGDVIHVFRYSGKTGKAKRAGLIEVPAPDNTPPPQDFPPTRTDSVSWPRDLAISPDGKTLLAALNLAHSAAIVDTASKEVRYVATGRYPYGAAITRDGAKGLVSNEADGTVSVIDLAAGEEEKEITVGPHLSHPEGMAADPKADRVYVAVTHQDLVRVIDTKTMEVVRSLSVERPQGLGTAPVAVSVTGDGRRLIVTNSGEDAVAVFALPGAAKKPVSRQAARADRVLQHEGRRNVEQAEIEREEAAEIYGEEAEEEVEAVKAVRPVQRRPKAWELIGRVPTASYPTWAGATSRRRSLVWVTAEGAGSGPNSLKPGETVERDTGSSTSDAPASFRFKYLPSYTFGRSGVLPFPSDARLRKLTPRASRQIRPSNRQKPPADTPLKTPAAGGKFKHVFYIVRENRTYDQIFGADPRGDGDPKLELFGEEVTPNAHALAKRFPLLDHVYANSEASIDGHFWTSAAAVSDYVSKNWHQNYAGRTRPYDFGVYSVTWPAAGFLFDQAEKQGISWFNFGEAIAGNVPLKDDDRTPEETERVVAKFRKSDLGTTPGFLRPFLVVEDTGAGCFPNDASSGGVDEVLSAGPAPDIEVYDSALPQPGDGKTQKAPDASAQSRFSCFEQKFKQQLADDAVPQFTYITYSNDHTAGTRPGRRTPNAMIAENDWALGETVELISKSEIWKDSLILVIEDDSQDGADHVDAHRIPAFAISPYAREGAVIHTRYDFLSFIRTLEIAVGMEPLNLFDAVAVPMYDVFTPAPDNDDPYEAIVPDVDMTERNTETSPNARLSKRLPLGFTDRTPQRYLDKILWQYVHGLDSEPPPPGPNASGIDEARWRRSGGTSVEQALEQARAVWGWGEEEDE
jgi:DNA-binding beta-propeller fold protein YncE